MTSASSELAAWSYGLAGLIFSAFALRLWTLGYARSPRNATSVSLVAAASCSALWAVCGLADFYSTDLAWRAVAVVADIARYASWYVCLLSFLGSVKTHAPLVYHPSSRPCSRSGPPRCRSSSRARGRWSC